MSDVPSSKRSGGEVRPPKEVSQCVRELSYEVGEAPADQRGGLGWSTVARLAGSLSCSPGSVAVAALRLAAGEKNP